MHAILRPLKEVTAAVARALGETSIWEISSGAAQGGGWRIGNTPTPNLSSLGTGRWEEEEREMPDRNGSERSHERSPPTPT